MKSSRFEITLSDTLQNIVDKPLGNVYGGYTERH